MSGYQNPAEISAAEEHLRRLEKAQDDSSGTRGDELHQAQLAQAYALVSIAKSLASLDRFGIDVRQR